MNRRRFVLLTAAALPSLVRGAKGEAPALAPLLEEIRRKRQVPALTGGIVTPDGLQVSAATGTRKAGGKIPVTRHDLWHLGSLTKAMTATLLATFVKEGRLKWNATLGDLLPDLMQRATPDARKITVSHLLTHRSGLPANREQWKALPAAGNRPEIIRIECARPLLSPPGATYLYSNVGYMIAGVIVTRLDGRLWEKVIIDRLFRPLGMKAGFGGTGTPGKEDQPWPHSEDGKPMPANGPAMDNPASLGPAGTCHAALGEYAKFIADHLRGAAGKKALLPPALYHDLHTPPDGADYAFGWQAVQRAWAGGTTLTHNGTNTMNYAVVWMSPKQGFAVVAACNQGGDRAAAACDDVCSLLIERRN
jgi:CubicO group peptidase (beta-lactamase class C family)